MLSARGTSGVWRNGQTEVSKFSKILHFRHPYSPDSNEVESSSEESYLGGYQADQEIDQQSVLQRKSTVSWVLLVKALPAGEGECSSMMRDISGVLGPVVDYPVQEKLGHIGVNQQR